MQFIIIFRILSILIVCVVYRPKNAPTENYKHKTILDTYLIPIKKKKKNQCIGYIKIYNLIFVCHLGCVCFGFKSLSKMFFCKCGCLVVHRK